MGKSRLVLLLVLGCGAPASPAPSSPAPSPTDVAPAPVVVDAPVIEQVSLTLGGTTDDVTLDSLDPGDASRLGRADLHVRDEAWLSIPIPGCALGGGSGWTVEHADPGPGPWARFLRTPQAPATDGEDQLPHEIGITGSIVAFGHRLTPVRIEPREGGAFYFAFTTSHPDVAEGSPQPAQQLFVPGQPASEQGLGQQVLTLALGEPGILGCRTVRLTVLDPRSQIVDVTDGGTATIRTFARMRLGDVTIRWNGVGEARRIGGDVMMLFFEGTVGEGAVEPFTCGGDGPCTFHDVLIEPLALQEPGAQSTFRLTRSAPGSSTQ